MKEQITYRHAGSVMDSALHGKSEKDAELWQQISRAFILQKTTEHWIEAAGEALGRKSRLESVEEIDGAVHCVINVANENVRRAAQFRRAAIESNLSYIFKKPVIIKFVLGGIARYTPAAEAASYKYRKKIIISDADVQKEADILQKNGTTRELAVQIARLKLTVEKIGK